MLLAAGVAVDTGVSVVNFMVGALALIMGLAAAIALVRASLVKSTVEGLRADRDDLTARVERLENEKAERDRKINDLTERLVREQQEREALARVVTGSDLLERVERAIAEHDQRVIAEQRWLRKFLQEWYQQWRHRRAPHATP